jgi:uncharacterized protein YneF (UPF0154 family)
MYEFIGEHKKTLYAIVGVIIALIIAFDIGYYVGSRNNRAEPTDNNAISEVQRAAELNKQAGAAIDKASSHIANAEANNQRASQISERIADTVKSNAAGINECQSIVNELQSNNRRAKSILTEVKPAD